MVEMNLVKMELIALLLLGVIGQKALSQEIHHSIIWDRFWLFTNNMSTVYVSLNDRITFYCQVNDDEAVEDQHDNIVLLLDEREANQCISTPDTSFLIEICADPGAGTTININRGLPLANRLAIFEKGLVFYVTSFSDGRLDSLLSKQPRILGGGACASMPPLKLTVSIAPDMVATAKVEPTSSLGHTPVTAVTSSGTTTSTMMTAAPSPTDSSTNPTSAIDVKTDNRSERVMPSCIVTLLIVTTVYLIM